MPQHSHILPLSQENHSDALAFSYGAFLQLGWTAEYATENRLIGYSKKSWNKPHDHIIVDIADGVLKITSRLPGNPVLDILKKNKRNVANFLGTYEAINADPDKEKLGWWLQGIQHLQATTHQAVQGEQNYLSEVDAAMNLSRSSKAITYTIIGVNVLVFIAMTASGVDILNPSTQQLAEWGGSFKPYITGGEWWRLLTSTFVHAGIVHLLFNMYAFYSVGIYLEPMLGKLRYITAYLCTGVLASLTSIWWHGEEIVGVGASGAIFGVYGVFIALLTTKIVPDKMRKALLQSIGVFVAYNLLYGAAKTGIDNAAHMGGLISGFIIGYCYYFSLKNYVRLRPTLISAGLLTITITISGFYLTNSKDDALSYQRHIEQFGKIEDEALSPLKNPRDPNLLRSVSTISQPKWAEAKKLVAETSNYRLNARLKTHQSLITEYIDLRIKQTDLIILALQGHNDVNKELETVSSAVNEKIKELQGK